MGVFCILKIAKSKHRLYTAVNRNFILQSSYRPMPASHPCFHRYLLPSPAFVLPNPAGHLHLCGRIYCSPFHLHDCLCRLDHRLSKKMLLHVEQSAAPTLWFPAPRCRPLIGLCWRMSPLEVFPMVSDAASQLDTAMRLQKSDWLFNHPMYAFSLAICTLFFGIEIVLLAIILR